MRPNWHSEPVTSKRLHMRRRFNTHTPTPSMPTQSYPHYPQVRAFTVYATAQANRLPAVSTHGNRTITCENDLHLCEFCNITFRSGPLLWRPCQAGFPIRLAIGCHIPSRSHPTSLVAVTIDRWLPPRTCQEPSGSCMLSPLPTCCSS